MARDSERSLHGHRSGNPTRSIPSCPLWLDTWHGRGRNERQPFWVLASGRKGGGAARPLALNLVTSEGHLPKNQRVDRHRPCPHTRQQRFCDPALPLGTGSHHIQKHAGIHQPRPFPCCPSSLTPAWGQDRVGAQPRCRPGAAGALAGPCTQATAQLSAPLPRYGGGSGQPLRSRRLLLRKL